MSRPILALCLALAAVCVFAAPASAEMKTCGDRVDGTFSTVSGTFTEVAKCEFTAPSSGTAIVLATSGLGFVDADYEALLSLNVDSPTAPSFGDPKSRYVNIYGDAGGNGTDKTTALQSTFAVTAGTHSAYLLASRQTGLGTVSLSDPSLEVIFVPDDEPGIEICSEQDGETYLNSTTTFTTAATCSFNAATPGFVWTLASGSAALSGGAYEANFRLGIDEATSGLATTDRYVNIYPDSGDGTDETVAAEILTTVPAGAHTLSFIGQRFGSNSGTGTVQVYDPGIIGLFIPADYEGVQLCSATGADTYDNNTTSFTTARECSLDLAEDSDVLIHAGASGAMAFPQGAAAEWEGQFALGVDATASVERALNIYYDGAEGDGTDRGIAASVLAEDVPAGVHDFSFLGRRNAGTGMVRAYAAALSVLAFRAEPPPPIPPAAPKLIASNPSSPSAELSPRILGTAAAGTTVRLYTDAGCTNLAASGPAAEFESTGIKVSVPAGSTTTFRATATDVATSTCSTSSLTYTVAAGAQPGGGLQGGSGGGGGGGSSTQAPGISGLRLSPASFLATNTVTPVAASASKARGTTIRFGLSAAATVRFMVLRDPRRREQPGRLGSPAHSFTRSLGAGEQAIPFSGRLGNRIFPPGRYRLYAVATDKDGKRSERVSVLFRILAP
jgi:hypothetical protein